MWVEQEDTLFVVDGNTHACLWWTCLPARTSCNDAREQVGCNFKPGALFCQGGWSVGVWCSFSCVFLKPVCSQRVDTGRVAKQEAISCRPRCITRMALAAATLLLAPANGRGGMFRAPAVSHRESG